LCFQLGKARGRPIYSPDNLIKRTRKAAGISYSSVYRVVNGKSLPESDRPKERKITLDDFDRCVIKRTVHSMYNRKIAPTVSKITVLIQIYDFIPILSKLPNFSEVITPIIYY
jgi:hypothetical protein